jgi:predicted transcriptional regulator
MAQSGTTVSRIRFAHAGYSVRARPARPTLALRAGKPGVHLFRFYVLHFSMTKEQIAEVFERVRTWPPEKQAHAVELLLLLEAQDEAPLRVSDAEWEAIQEGNAQAERGEFVSDQDMAAVYKRYGL